MSLRVDLLNGGNLWLQKTRYTGGVEEQLPPPPSPPQLKETGQLDGVSRPNSVERILHPDGSQHILTSHETLTKVRFNSFFSLMCRRKF